jgi:hypothetical protein
MDKQCVIGVALNEIVILSHRRRIGVQGGGVLELGERLMESALSCFFYFQER